MGQHRNDMYVKHHCGSLLDYMYLADMFYNYGMLAMIPSALDLPGKNWCHSS